MKMIHRTGAEFLVNKEMSIHTTGYNLATSLLLPFLTLFLPLLFDDNVAKILAVLFGAIIGGVAVDYIRPEKTIWRNIRKIICSSLFAIPPSFALSRYYDFTTWEYSLMLGFVNGLIAIILVTIILKIADEKLEGVITKYLLKETKTTEILEVREKEAE